MKQTLEGFSQFREQLYQLYQTCSSRASALLELIDAVAQTPRPHSPAELSLAMQRHWTTLYDALHNGSFDLDKLRSFLVKAASTAAPLRLAGRRVLLVDHTGYPRSSARTVQERERYHGPNSSRPVGHRYSWLNQVVDVDSAWLAPLDVQRCSASNTPLGTALDQVKRVAEHSPEPLLVVGDREYGVNEVLRQAQAPALPPEQLNWVVRLCTNLVFYLPAPPRQEGHKGAPRRYGARVQLNDPASWPTPDWQSTTQLPNGERMEQRGWGHWHRRGFAQQPVRVVQIRGADTHAVQRWAAQVCPTTLIDGVGGVGLAAFRAGVSAALAGRDLARSGQGVVGLEPSGIGRCAAARPLAVGGAVGGLAVGGLAVADGEGVGAGLSASMGTGQSERGVALYILPNP